MTHGVGEPFHISRILAVNDTFSYSIAAVMEGFHPFLLRVMPWEEYQYFLKRR